MNMNKKLNMRRMMGKRRRKLFGLVHLMEESKY